MLRKYMYFWVNTRTKREILFKVNIGLDQACFWLATFHYVSGLCSSEGYISS